MKSKNKQIFFTGELDEISNLINDQNELDYGKLYDWLLNSKNITCDADVKAKINQIVRKNKLNNINNL